MKRTPRPAKKQLFEAEPVNNRLYLDCYAMVGKKGPKDVETPYETEVLLEEMEWCGIQGALIAHSTAKEYDPIYGNRMLLQELKKSRRLYGVWTVMPHHTREFPIAGMVDPDLRVGIAA